MQKLRTCATWLRQVILIWKQLNEAGGVYAVMNELSKKDLLNLDCITVTGKTVGENIANDCETRTHEVIQSNR